MRVDNIRQPIVFRGKEYKSINSLAKEYKQISKAQWYRRLEQGLTPEQSFKWTSLSAQERKAIKANIGKGRVDDMEESDHMDELIKEKNDEIENYKSLWLGEKDKKEKFERENKHLKLDNDKLKTIIGNESSKSRKLFLENSKLKALIKQ